MDIDVIEQLKNAFLGAESSNIQKFINFFPNIIYASIVIIIGIILGYLVGKIVIKSTDKLGRIWNIGKRIGLTDLLKRQKYSLQTQS